MKIKQWILVTCMGMMSVQGNAQAVSDLEYEGRQNYGLKLGMGLNSMYGGKLINPRPTVGFMAGVYLHTNPEKRSPLGFQTGLDLRMRGSNFANGKQGDSNINRSYTKIAIMSMDVPLLMTYRLSKQRDKTIKQLQAGLQLGYNFNSVMYVGPGKIPLPTSLSTFNSTEKWNRLPIKLMDYQATVGYQSRGESFGYSVSVKMGLRNLNDDFVIRGLVDLNNDGIPETEQELISPSTDPKNEKPGTPQMIGTWSVEFALVF